MVLARLSTLDHHFIQALAVVYVCFAVYIWMLLCVIQYYCCLNLYNRVWWLIKRQNIITAVSGRIRDQLGRAQLIMVSLPCQLRVTCLNQQSCRSQTGLDYSRTPLGTRSIVAGHYPQVTIFLSCSWTGFK